MGKSRLRYFSAKAHLEHRVPYSRRGGVRHHDQPLSLFWQAAEEVEDIHAHPRRERLRKAPQQGQAALHRIEVDTLVGMAFSNLVALAIMLTAALPLMRMV